MAGRVTWSARLSLRSNSRPARPARRPVLTLVGHYDRVDWLYAPVDAVENTSIRDDFNQMGTAGHVESVEALARSREHLAAPAFDP